MIAASGSGTASTFSFNSTLPVRDYPVVLYGMTILVKSAFVLDKSKEDKPHEETMREMDAIRSEIAEVKRLLVAQTPTAQDLQIPIDDQTNGKGKNGEYT